MENTLDITADLKAFQNSPDGYGYALRLDLAELIVRTLNRTGMTQKELAAKAGVKPSFISRIIQGATNCTFDTAGNILFALEIKAKLSPTDVSRDGDVYDMVAIDAEFLEENVTNGKEEEIRGEAYVEPLYAGSRKGKGNAPRLRQRA